jgi:hypothetical protein
LLRVLKKGGRIAFATWPPEHFFGLMFAFVARSSKPAPAPPGLDPPAPPPLWGDPNVIRERLGDAVTDLKFARDTLVAPAMSIAHFRTAQEATIAPLKKLVESVANEPDKLAKVRSEFEAMAADVFEGNAVHLPFLMTRATKV